MSAQKLPPEDALAIHQLLAEYGNIIDEREWNRVPELFTADAIYDLTAFGYGVITGYAAISKFWENSDAHPLAHHVTNVALYPESKDSVAAYSKIIGVGFQNKAGSATYRDQIARTEEGWRIVFRKVEPRLAEDWKNR